MAELLFTFAIEQLLERVLEFAIQEITGAWGLKEDLQKLAEFIRSIDGKVKEAQNYEGANSQSVKTLLVKLQDVLYSAEDVLDEFSFEILRRKIEFQPRPTLRIRGFASRNNPILFRLKMARKVKKINQSLADIEKQALRDFALTGKAVTDPVVVSNDQPDRVSVSYFEKTEPPAVGRANEVDAIINMLQASSSTPSPLTVVSIVGFGGLGKTTLAKMVFHRVKETTKLFDETIWVCVSEPFEVDKILKGMLEILDKNTAAPGTLQAILERLTEKLKGKRFLLVLDDVWEDDVTNCNTLKNHLLTICGGTENFVIVTTRKLDVAKAMDSQDEHVVELKELEDKECWDIIRNKCVKQWGGGSVPKELEEVGFEIGKKCKGVPLIAKVVGGTLCMKKNREEWLLILQNNAWDQIHNDKQILPVLKLSFHHLHSSLKRCFVYCSLFPKDFKYEKQKLIEFWMAEGFLNRTSTTNGGSSEKSMEAVGEECFNALIFHSFLQDVEVDEFGNITSCKMHDLLHDVASSVSNYKRLKWKDESEFFVRTFDHQHHPTAQELERGGARNVRCVICKDIGEVSHMFSTFKSLRSLDISRARLEEIPSIVGRLKHLRYLDISYNHDMEELPEFITKLYNLQSIWLVRCRGITELPNNMVNLVRLRHIHFNMRGLKIYNVGRLIELRILPYFEVGKEDGFRIEELEKLNKLTGTLAIYSVQNIRDKEEAERGKLEEKKNLIELTLEWDRHKESNYEDVLEGMLPPPNIKRLTIENYEGVKFSNWMSIGMNNYLSQLERLSLRNCGKCKLMPSLGHLPRLKFLQVEELKNIRIIGGEFYGGECNGEVTLFPQLREFTVNNMKSLEEWVAAVEDEEEKSVVVFPLLEKLYIKNCPRLRSIPLRHLSSLVILNIQKCEDMKYLSNDIQNLPSLVDLDIRDCRNLMSSMNDDIFSSLTQLKKLRIGGPFSVELDEFPGMISIHLLSSSLEILDIRGWPKLKSLPQHLQHLTSLKELTIGDFKGVETLPDWLGNLSSLQQLQLWWCDNLKELPTTIKSLSNLTTLESYGCPLLKQRYNQDTGPDRNHISHVARIYFGPF